MTKEEWKELRSQVDDSFWVMRVIGESSDTLSSTHSAHAFCSGYPPLPNDYDGFSCGAHRYRISDIHYCDGT